MSRRFQLHRLLSDYEPSANEELVLAEMLLLLNSPGDPLSRYRFEPGHFTAAGYVLSADLSQVVLIRHRRLEAWLPPGGHIDPEDTDVVAAAMREVKEETGVDPLGPLGPGIVDVGVHPIPAGSNEPPHLHFNVSFLFAASAGRLDPSAEVEDAVWQPLDRVAELSPDRAVARSADKLLELVRAGAIQPPRISPHG